MTDLQPVKGTRDFYPEQMRLRNWLFSIWKETAASFGFEEYDACALESEELYIRKAGDEITGQLYNFEDKGGRRLALRPEMTPTLARMILQRQKALHFPLKWSAIPQCFRYERMTRGRKREHFQWNLDVVGQPLHVAEVELISALITALKAMGLGSSQVCLHINDRRLLGSVLHHIGIPDAAHQPVMVVMDKRDKITPEHLESLLAEQGLDGPQLGRLTKFLAMKTLGEVKAALGPVPGVNELETLMDMLGRVGFSDFIRFDITVVRGLSYYTGTVFELRDTAGKLRAICGGGRYDSLLSSLGGDPIPAAGFGFGDVVILELLADLNLLPPLAPQTDFILLPYSEQEIPAALEISQRLRTQGWTVDADFSMRRLKRGLQRGEEIGAKKAILLMPDELSRNELVVRDMALRKEETVGMESFFTSLDGPR